MADALKKHRLDDTVVCVLGTTETQGHNYFQTVSEFLFFDDANEETKLATQQISLHVRPDGKQGMGTFPVGTILKFDGVRAWGPSGVSREEFDMLEHFHHHRTGNGEMITFRDMCERNLARCQELFLSNQDPMP